MKPGSLLRDDTTARPCGFALVSAVVETVSECLWVGGFDGEFNR